MIGILGWAPGFKIDLRTARVEWKHTSMYLHKLQYVRIIFFCFALRPARQNSYIMDVTLLFLSTYVQQRQLFSIKNHLND